MATTVRDPLADFPVFHAETDALVPEPRRLRAAYGFDDVAIVPGYTDRSYTAIEEEVAPIVEAGVVPLLVGGDHACTLPHLRATRSRGPVAVIDFDSHTDAWDSYFGEKYNHGTWMRRAIEEGLVDVAHSVIDGDLMPKPPLAGRPS